MARNEGKQAAEALTDFLNSATSQDRDQFVETLMSEHRFLQQEAFNLMLRSIQAWSIQGQKGQYDPRNEHAVTTSHNISRFLGL